MRSSRVGNALRQFRQSAGLLQQELADRAAITRQALSALESGNASPSVPVALRLARVLACQVENLFWIEDPRRRLRVELVSDRAGQDSRRLAIAKIGGRWLARPLATEQTSTGLIPADALLRSSRRARGHPTRAPKSTRNSAGLGSGRMVTVEPLRAPEQLQQNVWALGCDPALGLLSASIDERQAGARLKWLHASSMSALLALQARQAHIAGCHLLDEETNEFNLPFVRRLFPSRPMVVLNLARWEQGLIVRAGNPLRIRRVEQLAGKKIRFINREVGAGARTLLDRLLLKARMPGKRIDGYGRIAAGHWAVAQTVALGAADAGIGTEAAARAHGLDFIPLAIERSDLVLAKELCRESRMQRIIATLESRAFRRELAGLGGYELRQSGQLTEVNVG
jgi:putative molybdopterin biosynthesis protein